MLRLAGLQRGVGLPTSAAFRATRCQTASSHGKLLRNISQPWLPREPAARWARCAKHRAPRHGQRRKQAGEALRERNSQAARPPTCLAPHACSCPKTWSPWGRARVLQPGLRCGISPLVPIPGLHELIRSSILPVPPSSPVPAGASNWWWQHPAALTALNCAGIAAWGQHSPSPSPAPARPPEKQLSGHINITAFLS